MINLHGEVISRAVGFALLIDKEFTAHAFRPTAADHLAMSRSTVMLDSSIIEVHAGDLLEISDGVGIVGFLTIDNNATAHVLIGDMEMQAPSSAADVTASTTVSAA